MVKKRFLLPLLFAASTFGQVTSHAPRCGIERQAVKTSADSDWNRVDLTPLPITIARLTDFEAPDGAQVKAAANTRFAEELRVFTVQGYLVGFKYENDLDFHIVIADLGDPSITMIVEMVSEKCVTEMFKKESAALRASWQGRFGPATAKFRRVAVNKIKVEITGVGFFDVLHGQTGVAKNGFELHRVLAWRELF